jgi:hypothetical protein
VFIFCEKRFYLHTHFVWAASSKGEVVGHEFDHSLHPVPLLRMYGSIPPHPIRLHGLHEDNFTFIHGDQKVSVHLVIKVQKYAKNMTTEYIRNVDRAVLNTIFENTVRRVNKFLDTARGTL